MTVRAAVRADAPRIAELCNAISRDVDGTADVDAQEVAGWFSWPNLAMFVLERHGRLAGYADVRDDVGALFPVDLRVHPSARATKVPDELLTTAETWAAERARPGAVLRAYASDRDESMSSMLDRHGYRIVRYSFEMQIALGPDLEPPTWPEGIAVRTYDASRDEERVHQCHQEAFADAWDFRPFPLDEWRRVQLGHPRFDAQLWWLAEEGDEIAGISLNGWHVSGDPAFGWIGALAVRRRWRRRGLGLALLRHSFADFFRRGATRVGLGVDAANPTGAVRLYERAGMRPVRRNVTYERALA